MSALGSSSCGFGEASGCDEYSMFGACGRRVTLKQRNGFSSYGFRGVVALCLDSDCC